MRKGTVLSIDDDENLQIVISSYLEGDGYNVIQARDAKTALDTVETKELDVILLDLILPDSEGLTLLSQFKSKTNSAIIVVSGKAETTEKIICLEMGADDYLTKPFEMRELSARIKAVLRRMEPINDDPTQTPSSTSQPEQIIFGDGWCLDRTQYQLFDKEKTPVDITTGQFKLLETLIRAPNRALSREQLFDMTKDGELEAYDRSIDIQIARLRKKLNNPDIIKTIRGVGYMFCGTVEK